MQKALDEAIEEFAGDFGYDLDEDGQPEDEGDESKGSSNRDDSDGGGDDDEEESSKEPVGAGSSER